MSKRTSMLKQRISTVGFNSGGFTSTPNFRPMSPISPSDSASIRFSGTADADDVSLSDRRAMLGSRKGSVRQLQGRQSPAWNSAAELASFNSHQPERASGGMDPTKRESLLHTWRESLREDGRPRTSAAATADEGRRMAMINERRREQHATQQHQQAQQIRDHTFDNMMRRGDMLDLHREALKRMQANARTE